MNELGVPGFVIAKFEKVIGGVSPGLKGKPHAMLLADQLKATDPGGLEAPRTYVDFYGKTLRPVGAVAGAAPGWSKGLDTTDTGPGPTEFR